MTDAFAKEKNTTKFLHLGFICIVMYESSLCWHALWHTFLSFPKHLPFTVTQNLSWNIYYDAGNKYPLAVCLATPELLSEPSCSAHITASRCALNPGITTIPACAQAMVGYQPTVFECKKNEKILCNLNFCNNHHFWKCSWNIFSFNDNIQPE